jgi:hypothetical protein
MTDRLNDLKNKLKAKPAQPQPSWMTSGTRDGATHPQFPAFVWDREGNEWLARDSDGFLVAVVGVVLNGQYNAKYELEDMRELPEYEPNQLFDTAEQAMAYTYTAGWISNT